MKHILFFFLCIAVADMAKGQTVPQQVAQKIAQRLKDSISLTDQQYASLVEVNLEIHNQKFQVRQTAPTDSLTLLVQRVENSRDQRYQGVLSEEQFRIYLQKKAVLIAAN